MALNQESNETKTIFIEKFLDKYFLQLPEKARTLSYFIILALFIFITVNIVIGNYVLTGRVFTKLSTDSIPSFGIYCIKIGLRSYGTNSEGEFYAVVPISDYLVSKTAGLEATVSSMDNRIPSQPIDLKAKFFRNTDVFDSRDNKTAIELFLARVRGWEAELQRI